MEYCFLYSLEPHITQLYNEDVESGLKLTSEHISLTAYSAMIVRHAAQVLTESFGNVLKHFGPPEAAGTAQLCIMIDKSIYILKTLLNIYQRKSLMTLMLILLG